MSDNNLQVLSFPKSGRTWLRVMLDDAGIAAKYTHLGWGHQHALPPEQLALTLNPFAKSVALFRDPRDTVVSGYYQVAFRLGTYSGSMSDFIREPGHGIEKVIRFNLGLAELCSGRRSCLVLTYEAMLADPSAALQTVAAFAGHPLDAQRAEKIASDNAFDRMQERERSGGYEQRYGKRLAVAADAPQAALKVRRGVAGGYVDELSKADVDFVNAVLDRESYFERMAQLT